MQCVVWVLLLLLQVDGVPQAFSCRPNTMNCKDPAAIRKYCPGLSWGLNPACQRACQQYKRSYNVSPHRICDKCVLPAELRMCVGSLVLQLWSVHITH
jgi:hypothetical protein